VSKNGTFLFCQQVTVDPLLDPEQRLVVAHGARSHEGGDPLPPPVSLARRRYLEPLIRNWTER
jgi:hypothetical protein